MRYRQILMTSALSVGMLVGALPGTALAHCDSMDGPVVEDAQRALGERDVTPVLKWVTGNDEAEIRSAFASCCSTSALGLRNPRSIWLR